MSEMRADQVQAALNDPVLIERLAEYAHKAWAGWMHYMTPKLNVPTPEGMEPYLDRWTRQADTEYRDLSEREKESDRDEAREMLRIVRAVLETNT